MTFNVGRHKRQVNQIKFQNSAITYFQFKVNNNYYYDYNIFNCFIISIFIYLLLMHLNLFALDYDQISNKHDILRCSAYYREVTITERRLFRPEWKTVRRLFKMRRLLEEIRLCEIK